MMSFNLKLVIIKILYSLIINKRVNRFITVRTKLIPLVPLCIVFDKTPFCLFKWKFKSSWWRCQNTLITKEVTELWVSRANIALRNSPNNDEPTRAAPYISAIFLNGFLIFSLRLTICITVRVVLSIVSVLLLYLDH